MSAPGLKYADRVQETTTTSGTGTLSMAGAVAGFQSFSSAFVTGQTVYYGLTDGTNWEVGQGTYTTSGDTLSRDVIFSSSNSGSAVSLTGATTNVWCDLPAQVLADKAVTVAFVMRMAPQ
jgi:hypothetical protein